MNQVGDFNARADEFRSQDAQVIVATDFHSDQRRRLEKLVKKMEWPIVRDADSQIAAAYGVAEQLNEFHAWDNRPSCFIVDRRGILRWKYVGKSINDRVSVTTALERLPKD